jgi:gliding motility-associated-like protein
MKNYILLCFYLILSTLTLNAQFILNGNASQIDEDCFELTPDALGQSGSAWFEEKINLNQSFDVRMSLNFGCKDDNGADGIVFILQPISTSIGSAGSGIGYQGINPSIGIEFDTWQNLEINDPSYDHIGIMINGSSNHNNSLEGPIQASASTLNIEDCMDHSVRINWNVNEQILSVYFDCELRLSTEIDLVNDVFGGDPSVFWGFSSATGGFSNKHVLCFELIQFNQELENFTLCPNGAYPIEGPIGNYTYEWNPSEGLSDHTIPNPIASPSETTTYILSLTDDCEYIFYDTITITVGEDPSFIDLGPDTTICEEDLFILDASTENATYIWNTGSTNPSIDILGSGFFSVTVEVNQSCFDWDEVAIEFKSLPELPSLEDFEEKCIGIDLIVDGSSPTQGVQYLWNNSIESSQITISESGLQSLSISNECGTNSVSFDVSEIDCEKHYVPNVFSPDNDGINDYFTLYSDAINEIVSLSIFDRWGNLVFEKRNFPASAEPYGWDGSSNGKSCESGTYTWFAEILFKDNQKKIKNGSITLIQNK